MQKIFLIAAAAAMVSVSYDTFAQAKTTFQTSTEWRPSIDNRADAVMVYGMSDDFEERVASWRGKGYDVHFMTGIAWGDYQDYFTGEWDGSPHFDEGQKNMVGDTIWHNPTVPYIVPTLNYIKYFKETKIKRAIDAGIDEIFLEEPEFWAFSGYSEAFRREWKAYYRSDWRPQDESPENTYLSNKLKYYLYYRALNEVCTYAKEYGRSLGRYVNCYVPTHSLINYTQWQIVSPEASLALLPCIDGYIAQVWTGTSRTPNYFNGVQKERVFETAFLEYGCLKSMVIPTGRKVWFLTDPIEDRPRDWEDYIKNYEATFTAQLLHPEIADYEVMPWPERIYEGTYQRSAIDTVKEGIPHDFATRMQVMINTLNKIPVSKKKVSGTGGISVLMANSLMFQGDVSDFFGLAMPLMKRGIPVEISHIENISIKRALKRVNVLLMTYANMKPLYPDAHEALARWVKKGGVLIYCGRDTDSFINVSEWWNTGENHYGSPAEHLFETLGLSDEVAKLKQDEDRTFACGNGSVSIIRRDPKEFTASEGEDAVLMAVLRQQYKNAAKGEDIQLKNSFDLQRGCYRVVSVIDEGVSDEPYTLAGHFIDLYDPELPAITLKTVSPGSQSLLVDIDKVKEKKRPQVLASGCRVYDEQVGKHSYAFTGKGPEGTDAAIRVLLPSEPLSVSIDGDIVESGLLQWDEVSHTCKLLHPNSPSGFSVTISW